jgi:peptidoglycan/xylan/chitin deacetylase (PgdA/CDA1 family)
MISWTRGVIRIQKHLSSHILLYHSSFAHVPDDIKEGLHNVTPDTIYRQIAWLKEYFDVVTVDELFDSKEDIAGKAAITFDDGYHSAFTEALPVLRSLNVPCTMYVTGISLTGKVFWRDKIRILMNKGMVPGFVEHYRKYCEANGITTTNFYTMTKSSHVNSGTIDGMLDEYLERMKVPMESQLYCVSEARQETGEQLVSYGNHTLNHYVLSSLSEEEQEREIGASHEMVSQCGGTVSRVFSVPFGGAGDFNATTVEILKRYQYRGFLYSRDRVNLNFLKNRQSVGGMTFRERYMVAPEYEMFRRQTSRVLLDTAVALAGVKA